MNLGTLMLLRGTETTETRFQVSETAPDNNERNEYWRKYRDVKRKYQNLENIIQTLSSPVKRNVCRDVSKEVLHFDKVICEGLMKYLRQLWDAKKYPEFYRFCGKFVVSM